MQQIEKMFARAVELHQHGDAARAESVYRELIELQPRHAAALGNLVVLLRTAGQSGQAEQLLRTSLKAWPDNAPAWIALSSILQARGELPQAESAVRKALGADPADYFAWLNLGAIAGARRNWIDSLAASLVALSIRKTGQEARQNAANAYFKLGHDTLAEKFYREALPAHPHPHGAFHDFAQFLKARRRYAESVVYFEKALAVDDSDPDVHINHGTALVGTGDLVKAEQAFHRSLELRQGGNWFAWHGLLFCLNYHASMSAEEIYGWHRRFGEDASRSVEGRVVSHAGWDWDGKRKLRIGYLSPDFKGHACRYFMEPLLREHDRSRFELFAYANVAQPDAHTERLKGYFDNWRDIMALSDDDAAALIAADKIDILIELAGHTADNRLLVCARKPAPIQATFLGYGNTTGLKEIDYYLCDAQTVPPGAEHLFSEQPWRLPVECCYEPDRALTPEVGELPALRNGYVTFGCLGRVLRMNERVIATWSEILKRLPSAKLRLDQKSFDEVRARETVWERFARHGIRRDQVILGYTSPHWPAFHEIDIALDSFPNNGGTGTLEAIWMGVPVLSKRDRPGPGRIAAYALHAMGLDDWLVDTEQDYIDQALRRAGDLEALARLRAALRQRMEDSPLLQARQFTADLENAYQEMARKNSAQADPETGQARAALEHIQSALMQGQFQEAEETLDIILSILGENADALILAAMATLGQGKLEQAKDFAERLMRARPGWTEGTLTAAHVAFVTQDPEKALDLLDQVLRIDPAHANALALRAEIQGADCAIAAPAPPTASVARPTPKLKPLNAGAAAKSIEHGKKEFQAGRFQQALECFEQLLKTNPQHPVAMHLKATTLMQAGRLAESRIAFEAVLGLRPNEADIWDHYATLLRRMGKPEAACHAYEKAVALNPKYDTSLNNLGQLFIEQRDFEKAEAFTRKALEINPKKPSTLVTLGTIQVETARYADAIASFRKAIVLQPNLARAWQNQGVAEHRLGNPAEAEACYRKAAALAPHMTETWSNLSSLLREQHRLPDAEQVIDQGLSLAPQDPTLIGQKANVLVSAQRQREAISWYKKALAITPNAPDLYVNLGLAHFNLKQYDEAIQHYRKAVEINPGHAMGWNNLGGALQASRILPDAIAAYERAIACDSHFAEAHNNLGYCLMELARFDEALELFRKSKSLNPQYLGAQHNHLYCLNYHPYVSAEEIYEAHRHFGDAAARSVGDKEISHAGWNWDGQRKLRIGYLSPDFKGHACRYFIEPFLQAHDRSRFELFAYANVGHPDVHTERLKSYCDGWRDIITLSDDDAAALIAADKIDILVDLAGHTADNRLMVCARKPAPIQVTYMGYGYTTGLKAIDYYLGDPHLSPPGSEHLFSEKLWRLPVAACYEPDRDGTPAVSALPALRNDFVTFGSLVRTVRLNERVIAAWCEILRRVPGSKLRLNQKSFDEARTREMFLERFAAHGIERDRLILEYSSPHWPAYHQIDIVLDTFPNNGGTTTIESLWMGVPVLSRRDRPAAGRAGAYLLHAAGLDDWLVDTDEAYIEEAVRRAGDLDALGRLRAGLRPQLEQSPLMQPRVFTRNVENGYTDMARQKMEGRS